MTEYIEIQCIIKPDRNSRYGEIQSVGGVHNGKRWLLPQPRAIQGIESGEYSFYVTQGGRRVKVIVASRLGDKYLKTENDGDIPNNLLSLMSCPLN